MGAKKSLTWLALILFAGTSLSACSLDQRGAEGFARIQLNTRSASGGNGRLGTLTGAPQSGPYSFYVIDVEGEGIPREIVEPGRCLRASSTSSAMVPALLQSGEPARTEIELLVPVGANRRVRISRIDLIPGMNFQPPMWGENVVQYRKRNPGLFIAGDVFLLAEADIPFLTADQSVTLVEKPFAVPLGNLCLNSGPPPIANGEVILSEYSPTGALTLWNAPYDLFIRGKVRKASQIDFFTMFSPTLNVPGAATTQMQPNYQLTLGSANAYEQEFNQVYRVTPGAAGGVGNALVSVAYTGSGMTQSPVSWIFPFVARAESPPASISSLAFNSPLGVVFNGNSFLYPNTYLVTLTASRAMELLPASASDLVAYFTGQGGEPDAELVAAPPSASGTACPFREKDQLVSKLSLDPGQSCSYYVRVYQHPSSVNANYLIRFSSRSNGIVGQQTAPIVSDSAPGMTFTCSGKKYFPSVITMNQILVKTAGFYAYPAMSLLGSGNGTYTIPTSGLIAIDRVFIKYQNGSNCAASTGSFCGVSVNPVAGGGLLIPSATSGSPPVYAWVVAKETIPSTTTAIKFYKQELFFGEASLEIAEEVSPSHNGLDISMKVKH